MGSRRGGQTAARLWESSSTTAVMPSLQVQPGLVHNRRDSYLFLQLIACMAVMFNFWGVFFSQFLLLWELVSHVELDYTPTGSSSVVSLGCSCSSAPTGRPTCPGPCALACKSFRPISRSCRWLFRINQSSALLLSPGRYISTVSLGFAGST